MASVLPQAYSAPWCLDGNVIRPLVFHGFIVLVHELGYVCLNQHRLIETAWGRGNNLRQEREGE